MLDNKIKGLVEEICNEITSNQTDEIVVDIVDEIYLLKGFEKRKEKYSISSLQSEIDYLNNQWDLSKNEIDVLESEISYLEFKISELREQLEIEMGIRK